MIDPPAYGLDADDLSRSGNEDRTYTLAGGPYDGVRRKMSVRALVTAIGDPEEADFKRVLLYRRTAKTVFEFDGSTATMEAAFRRVSGERREAG